MTTALEQAQLTQQDATQLVSTLRQTLAEAEEKAILPAPAGAQAITNIIDAPDLDISNKLKLTIPIIPYLLDYEAEVQLDSTINLEMVWNMLKTKLGR